MAERKLSKDVLDKVNKAIVRNSIAESKYGSRPSGDDTRKQIEDYYKDRLGVTKLDKYLDKPVVFGVEGDVNPSKVAKEYQNLNQILFEDINKPEYLNIRAAIVSQVRFNSIEDYIELIDKLLDFGFNKDWPDWITFTQEGIFYKLRKETKFNDIEFKNEYAKLMKNSAVPKLFLDKHLVPGFEKFKV